MGAETRMQYAASTKFYLADKANGNPWITEVPFPVHVVERVENVDHISRNRLVTLCLSPWLLQWRRARIPRLRNGGAAGHRGVRSHYAAGVQRFKEIRIQSEHFTAGNQLARGFTPAQIESQPSSAMSTTSSRNTCLRS